MTDTLTQNNAMFINKKVSNTLWQTMTEIVKLGRRISETRARYNLVPRLENDTLKSAERDHEASRWYSNQLTKYPGVGAPANFG